VKSSPPERSAETLLILLVGETWVTHSTHVKGFDTFHTSEYVEGAHEFIAGLMDAGLRVVHIPSHAVPSDFPTTADALSEYDAVVLSDVGSNTFLLTPDTFSRSEPSPNRLDALAEYVAGGGGLLMIGGYMSFSGIDGRARYGRSPLAAALPVVTLDCDDRVETPQGVRPLVIQADHEILDEVPGDWPKLLGYNQVQAKEEAQVLARCGDDPLLVLGAHGAGRSAAFTSDLAPHWAPPEFVRWRGYLRLWLGLLKWLSAPARDRQLAVPRQ
jgi:uncharacterized membrane protein